jgi:hypothetical protein
MGVGVVGGVMVMGQGAVVLAGCYLRHLLLLLLVLR